MIENTVIIQGKKLLLTQQPYYLYSQIHVQVYGWKYEYLAARTSINDSELLTGKAGQFMLNVIYINQIQEFLTLSDKLTLKDIGTTFFIGDIFAIKHENLDSRIYLT